MNRKSLSAKLNELMHKQPEDSADGAICTMCHWRGPVEGLKSYLDYESWEHPQTYMVHVCPKCEHDIEEYYYLQDDLEVEE